MKEIDLSGQGLERFDIEDPLRECVGKILKNENLVPIKRFLSGDKGNIVMLTQNEKREKFVVKIPQDNTSQEEIFTNLKGYSQIKKEGISYILPDYIKSNSIDGSLVYLVTTYLGKDFATKIVEEADPRRLFSQLTNVLLPLYEATIKEDHQSQFFLENMQKLLQKNFYQYLMPAGLARHSDVPTLLEFETLSKSTPLSCFGVFDFTPENIYLFPNTIKFPDPKETIRGNPIIDISCFAGVSRDILNLPESQYGYSLLETFALDDVSELLKLSRDQAQQIFYLGRGIQHSLSARFRVNKDLEMANNHTKLSLNFLKLSLS